MFPNPRSHIGTMTDLNAVKRLLIQPKGKIGARGTNMVVDDIDAEGDFGNAPSYPGNNSRKSDLLGNLDAKLGRLAAGTTYRRLKHDPSGTDEVYADILHAGTDVEDDWDAIPDVAPAADPTATGKFTQDLAYPSGFPGDVREGAMWDAFRAAEQSGNRF